MSIRLLTFDLDNTLWYVDPVIIRAEQASYDWLVQQCPAIASLYNSPDSIREYRNQIAACYPELSFRVSKLREETLRLVLMQAGVEHERAAQLAQQAFAVFYNERNNIVLSDGAVEALSELQQHYQLMAITNGNASLQRAGVAQFFSQHFSAEVFGQPKPLPGMFNAAMEIAQVSPQQAIHIGDHPQDDIKAAASLGMKTIWMNYRQQPWPLTDIKPDAVITDLFQLVTAVSALK